MKYIPVHMVIFCGSVMFGFSLMGMKQIPSLTPGEKIVIAACKRGLFVQAQGKIPSLQLSSAASTQALLATVMHVVNYPYNPDQPGITKNLDAQAAAIISLLTQQGASVNCIQEKKQDTEESHIPLLYTTALFASKTGNSNMLRTLLEHNADLYQKGTLSQNTLEAVQSLATLGKKPIRYSREILDILMLYANNINFSQY
jgi:hypothetical protein